MNYYLDTEFNGFGGELLSMGLIREDGKCYYAYQAVINCANLDPFVKRHVYPYIKHTPKIEHIRTVSANRFTNFLSEVFSENPINDPITIISDWPDDIKYFCQSLITTPGNMINIAGINFRVIRVESYPNSLVNCTQHNAIWDAIALRYKLTGLSNYY